MPPFHKGAVRAKRGLGDTSPASGLRAAARVSERNREAALSAEMRWHAQRDGGVIPPQGKQVFIQLLQNHILHHLLGLTSETK